MKNVQSNIKEKAEFVLNQKLMMKRNILFIILTLAFGQTYGQTDSSSVYKGLKTKKIYSVNLSSHTSNGKSTFKVNGEKVTKHRYNKYYTMRKNLDNCCPCILNWYDINDNLIRESVSCSDCGVGWFKKYYKNGKLMLTGKYKENPTGNWDDIWNRGYCNVPNGQWTYFDKKGDSLYSEFWSNGQFVKQVPEQDSTEVWDVKLTLNGQNIEKQAIQINEISQLEAHVKYKNSHNHSKLSFTFEVSAIGHKMYKKRFSIDSFKDIDVTAILSEMGIPKDKKTTFVLSVFSDGQIEKSFFLNVKK